MIQVTPELISRYDKEGPRYTSYPTAPVWTSSFTASDYVAALETFKAHTEPLSLYVHIPFCEKRCYYCACNVVIRKPQVSVGDTYLDYLEKELQLIRRTLTEPPVIEQLHLGGGTPTFLTDAQLQRLCTMLATYLDMTGIKEKSIEVDPRSVTAARLQVLFDLGFDRLSFGIQDFDDLVQEAVGRLQPFSDVEALVASARSIGFHSINMDLIYGLPHQTATRFTKTVERVLALRPDRVALYSFAHVPWLHSHQRLLDHDACPSPDQKLDLFIQAREQFLGYGYEAIAMDHFALSTDELAMAYHENRLKRSFMGYTTLSTRYYLGLGVSAIGYLSDRFIQHTKDLKAYYEMLDNDTLPVEKGFELSQDDVMRQWVISSLMCQFNLDKVAFEQRFQCSFDQIFESEKGFLSECELEGLIHCSVQDITATELGRLFIRNVCMGFDTYFLRKNKAGRFSKTV